MFFIVNFVVLVFLLVTEYILIQILIKVENKSIIEFTFGVALTQ